MFFVYQLGSVVQQAVGSIRSLAARHLVVSGSLVYPNGSGRIGCKAAALSGGKHMFPDSKPPSPPEPRSIAQIIGMGGRQQVFEEMFDFAN